MLTINSLQQLGSMKKILRMLLQLAILFGLFFAYWGYQLSQYGPGEMESDHPDVQVVSSVLSGAEIVLLDSFAMSGSMTGDIDRGFAARVPGFNWGSLSEEIAYRGDRLPEDLARVVRFNAENLGLGDLDWFPGADDILSENYFVYGLAMDVQGENVDSGRILLLRPADQMVFYSWVKF